MCIPGTSLVWFCQQPTLRTDSLPFFSTDGGILRTKQVVHDTLESWFDPTLLEGIHQCCSCCAYFHWPGQMDDSSLPLFCRNTRKSPGCRQFVDLNDLMWQTLAAGFAIPKLSPFLWLLCRNYSQMVGLWHWISHILPTIHLSSCSLLFYTKY